MVEFIGGFIAVVLAFFAGMFFGNSPYRGNFKPIDSPDFDEKWIGEPPPHVPPNVVHLYAPWKK